MCDTEMGQVEQERCGIGKPDGPDRAISHVSLASKGRQFSLSRKIIPDYLLKWEK